MRTSFHSTQNGERGSSRAEAKPEQPKVEPENVPTQQSSEEGAGWWGGWSGGLFATATAAMKQAEAAVKEIQNNEEAQKWAQQVKGNVGALRDLGIDPLTQDLFTCRQS